MKVKKLDDGKLTFYCRGCNQRHYINELWNFNGNFDEPTFSPSILVKGTHPLTDEEYDLIMGGENVEPKPKVCHSFIRNGKIEYLSDCTHELAGQTVELLDESNWFED